MAIKTIEVNGVEYEIDFEGLANNPIPEITNSDSGKVLAVGDGMYAEWTSVPMLPEPPGYGNNLVLASVGSSVIEWAEKGVPDFDAEDDQGKVLAVLGSYGIGWVNLSDLNG